MATVKPGSGGGGVRSHPLVEKLAGDPATPPQRLVRLMGYPGPATTDGTTRLWLSLEFSDYVDIPNEKIAHYEFDEGNGPCTVFVAKGTKLELTSVTSTDVEADFLSGDITAARLSDSVSAESPAFPFGRGDVIDVQRPQLRSLIFRCVTQQPLRSCVVICNDFPTVRVRDCPTVIQPQCFQEELPLVPDLTTPVFVDIGRRVVQAGLNPQPLPPREGPLTRPAG
jgi:hypothetical protein